jgi:hypothetical protein
MEVAGIQIASMRSDGTEKMIAVPAQAIGRQDREIIIEPPTAVVASAGESAAACDSTSNGEAVASEGLASLASLATIRARLDFEQPDVVSSIPAQPADPARAMAMASEPFAIAIP